MTLPKLHSLDISLEKMAERLRAAGRRWVLAESCTSGLVAARLGSIPGISGLFCGSQVVYRTPTKTAWLGLDASMLADPSIGPVSETATRELALAILNQTPEADIAATITGHLGPGAPSEMDGLVFICIHPRTLLSEQPKVVAHRLQSPAPIGSRDFEGRRTRQHEAADLVFEAMSQWMSGVMR